MLEKCIEIPDTHNPAHNNAVDSQAARLMFFSTNAPKHDAPVPRKNIFKQNANCTATFDAPSSSCDGFANKLNA